MLNSVFSLVSLILLAKRTRKSFSIIPKWMVDLNYVPVMKSNSSLNTIPKVVNHVQVNSVASSKWCADRSETSRSWFSSSSFVSVIFNDLIDWLRNWNRSISMKTKVKNWWLFDSHAMPMKNQKVSLMPASNANRAGWSELKINYVSIEKGKLLTTNWISLEGWQKQ